MNSAATAIGRHKGTSLLALGAIALAGSAVIVNRRAREAEAEHPPAGRFLTANGVRLHYVERGNQADRPVIFMHGNGAMVDDLLISGIVDGAAQSGFRAIAIDRPGYGYSERPRGFVWNAHQQALLMRAAFKQLGVANPIVFGHSWGALVALALAIQEPSAVSGVVLASGYYFPSARADSVLLAPPAIPIVGDLLRHTIAPIIGEGLAPGIIGKMFAPQPVPAKFTARFPVGLTLRPSQIRALAAEATDMPWSAGQLSRDYGKITCPIAILAGNQDQIVDFESQPVRLHALLPQSTLDVLEGCGHMIHHIDPQRCVSAIQRVASAL